MLRSLAVLVLLVSLAAATPVVCLCMPTDQGYLPLMSLGAPESVSPAAGSVARVQIGHVGVTRPDGAPSDPAGRTHAQQPAGAAIAALALIATAVAPPAAVRLAFTVVAPARLRPPSTIAVSAAAAPPPAPPPRAQTPASAA